MSGRIGVIGLGSIGLALAGNLVRRGFDVTGYDIEVERRKMFEADGGKVVGEIAAVAAGHEVLICALPSSAAVQAVYVKSDLFTATSSGTLFVDLSTIDPEVFREARAAAVAHGCELVDAPLGGGVQGAASGTLTLMVGCEDSVFPRVQAATAEVAAKVIHAGPPGAGLLAKICNNMLVGINMLGICEMFALAETLEMDPARLFDIVSNATGQSWVLDNHCPVPGVVPTAAASHGYAPNGKTSLLVKDLRIAQRLGVERNVPTPLTSATAALYTLLMRTDPEDRDYAAMLEFLRADLTSSSGDSQQAS